MVCSLGSGRMEVMARFLAAGSFSQTIADDFGRSAAEHICRELREADEANLIDEEDMHIYGERPMTDLLHLVCCNFCKKPIKDSQHAAHVELCKSLKLTEQTSLELDGCTGNRKRKEKKKLPTSSANKAAAVGDQRRSESMDNIDTALSQSHLNSQTRMTSFSSEAKASMMDCTRINSGNRDHPSSVRHPPTKRHKLIASKNLPLPEIHVTESGLTKTVSFTDGINREELIERNVPKHEVPNHKNLGLVHEEHIMKNDFPAPLATKVYYSQRRNRLRAAIRDLYFQNVCEELCTDAASPKTSPVQDSCQMDPSNYARMDNEPNKENPKQILHPAQNSGAKRSDICTLKEGGLPCGGLSNRFLDNVSRSAATHDGLTRSNFLPKSYSFASNTGNPLGTMQVQQPNGSVPVI